MKKKRLNKVGFSLRKITTEQFAVIESNVNKELPVNLGTQLRFGLDNDNRLLSVIPFFKFEQENIPFIIIETACHFKISTEAWDSFISEKEGDNLISFPRNFVTHLAVIAVGTSRGVLHAKTENTKFNEFFLPTVNVENLISEDIEIELVGK